MSEPTVQLAPAMALVQLLKEHPELPTPIWRIQDGTLEGSLYGPAVGNMAGLAAYVDLMGGSVRARHAFTSGATCFRSHELTTVWRDVPIVVAISVPLAVSEEYEAALADQQHLLIDLDSVAVHRPVRLGAAA